MYEQTTISRLRYATPDQIDTIKDILNTHVSFGLTTDGSVFNLIRNHRVYIATQEDKIIGVATTYSSRTHIDIKHIVVLPEYRKKGIATSLLTHLLVDYLENNIAQLKPLIFRAEGWVKPDGWDADNLFRNHGFNLVEYNKGYWKDSCSSKDNCPYFNGDCVCDCKKVELVLNT